MSVINEIRNEANKVLTENGDVAYESTFNANLDFFGAAGATRYHLDNTEKLFNAAYFEDKALAVANMLYLRDVRKGLGEREAFRACVRRLHDISDAKTMERLLPFVVQYGRWDDVLVYLEYEDTAKIVAEFIRKQLEADVKTKQVNGTCSLCAKWMPSITTSSAETRKQAKKLCGLLGWSDKKYRKTLSFLRNGMIVERNLTDKEYSFAYDELPSKALNGHIAAFKRNDAERYDAYCESLKKGEAKAKVQTLAPHEIIRVLKKDAELAEAQWKSVECPTDNGNTIVVRDGSGSMTWEANGLPYEVATALSIMFAEHLTGDFKNKFITFSERPRLVELLDGTLKDKVLYLHNYNECANTNIEAVYELLLKASASVSDPKDYITRVVIISDMEFDCGTVGVPTYESAKQMFDDAGVPMPEVVYWRVATRNPHFAVKADQPNVKLVSGYATGTIDAIVNSEATGGVGLMQEVLKPYEADAKAILGI